MFDPARHGGPRRPTTTQLLEQPARGTSKRLEIVDGKDVIVDNEVTTSNLLDEADQLIREYEENGILDEEEETDPYEEITPVDLEELHQMAVENGVIPEEQNNYTTFREPNNAAQLTQETEVTQSIATVSTAQVQD